MAWSKLKTQWERGEELELLREFQGPIGWIGPVALPAFEAILSMVAGIVAFIIHHVQDVPFHALHGEWNLIVWAVDIQVVIDAHLHGVVTLMKPARGWHKNKMGG